MPRIAWFTPWHPQISGVAGRSADATARLAARGHAIDVVVDEREVAVSRANDAAPADGVVRCVPAHDFVWRRQRGQYDLCVYQVGNSRAHEFIWPYLFRWPGLVVLHDARLHHARSRALLARKRYDDYRAELAFDHPGREDAAEVAIRGFDGAYYYLWPMTRAVVESARLVACHVRQAARDLADAHPGRPIEYLPLGEGRDAPLDDASRAAARDALGLSDDVVVFGVFGGLGRPRRLDPILRAFAATAARVPGLKLLLAGTADPEFDLDAEIRSLDLGQSIVRLDRPDDERFDRAIAASDVTLNLRWPTSVEISGPWLRALAAGRPTIVLDVETFAGCPTLDPRTWHLHAPAAASDESAVAVAIDVLDEDHSLRLAMQRLAIDGPLRTRIGRAGRAYWEAEHSVGRMVDGYDQLITKALALRDPSPDLPAHLRPDPLHHARALVRDFGDAAVETTVDALDRP